MKHGLIALVTVLVTSIAGSALDACPEGRVEVAMVPPLDAGSTILANGVTVQRGKLAHVTYVPSSPTRVWSFPEFPNTDRYGDGQRARLHGDSFEWPRRIDSK